MKYLLLTAFGFGLLISLSSIRTMVQAKQSTCTQQQAMAGMPKDSVACMAYMPSWTYDASKNECVEFIFGGCGGNDNQFGSKSECETSCKK